jgi:hypothetical protein
MPVELVDDQRFRDFDRLVQRRPDSVLYATLVGRFFSGERQDIKGGILPGGAVWRGFGHMGCCSLLAIQQILDVEPQDRNDLDYRADADQPDVDKLNCGYQDLIPIVAYHSSMEAQHKAESGDEEWAFDSPLRVASVSLARLLKIPESSISGIEKTRGDQGRIVYEWHPKPKGAFYMLVVSRPYWISFYAKDSSKVAWVVTAAYRVCDSE